jgi:hypothetical protein
VADEPIQIENTKLMLDERERIAKPKKLQEPKPQQAQRAVPSWRRWMLSLDLDELLILFQDPTGQGTWNDELRAELLELIRQKGGDQAVRRAIGLHFDRPSSRAERPDARGAEAPGAGRRRLWRGTAVAEPGRRLAVERVGRAWVEAYLAWRLDRLEAEGTAPPLDLTETLRSEWPELVPPPLVQGAPGVQIELDGPRRATSPSGLLRQHDQAFASLLDAAQGMATTLYGRVERSDGSIEWIYAMRSEGLTPEALTAAFDEVSRPGVFVGRLRQLSVLLRPSLAYHDDAGESVLAGPMPAAAPPDPVRPGPLRFELLASAPLISWRVHVGPEAAVGITGTLNAGRVLALLARVSNTGFLPAGDPAARLAPPAPLLRRTNEPGVKTTWTRRPGDSKACASFEGDAEAVAKAREKVVASGDADSERAAALTAPDGPVPGPLP